MKELLAAGLALVLVLAGMVVALRVIEKYDHHETSEIRYEPQGKKSVSATAAEPQE